jgi:hypothetical protein
MSDSSSSDNDEDSKSASSHLSEGSNASTEETTTTSCNPSYYIDILVTTMERDEILHNNVLHTNLHLDTKRILKLCQALCHTFYH